MVDISNSEEEDKQKGDRMVKKLFYEEDDASVSKCKEYEPWKEKTRSV